jgi:hypothetical protein
LPLYEKARIEIYLPDLPRRAYQDLLDELEQELTYAFGGCTLVRGLEGNYLSRVGIHIRDRINLLYTDTPFSVVDHFKDVSHYADELRLTAINALEEEAVLVAVYTVFHSG